MGGYFAGKRLGVQIFLIARVDSKWIYIFTDQDKALDNLSSAVRNQKVIANAIQSEVQDQDG